MTQLAGVSPENRPPGCSAYPIGVAWTLARRLGIDVPGGGPRTRLRARRLG